MKNHDIILRQIADTLIMYAYHIKENGLLDGKTGAMFYLYLYAEKYDNQTCYDFAAELLEGLMKSTSGAPTSFEDGIAGLGWCIGRLVRSGIVAGKTNSVLGGIDRQLIEAMMRERWSGNWHELIYFADRIKDNPAPIDGHTPEELILTFIDWQLKERTDGRLSEERRDVVRHYLKCYRAAYGETDKVGELWRKAGTPDKENATPLSSAIYENETSAMREWIITALWQKIFGREQMTMPDTGELREFVEDTLRGLVPDDLTLSGGLAGLGTVMIGF